MRQNTVQKVAVMLLIIGLIIPCHLLTGVRYIYWPMDLQTYFE